MCCKVLPVKTCLVGVLCSLCMISVSAQTGGWIEHTLADFSSGTTLRDRDEGCLVYTRSNASIILVFDVGTGEWLRVDLGAPQNFNDAMTAGNVVFAWSDSLLFGYSAKTQDWDTTAFTGGYMGGTSYYIDCGRNLACFVTRGYMYVFDSDLGAWQSYAYGLPADYTSGSMWVTDTYVGMKLTIPYPGEPKNVVYSGLTHGFNQIELGVYQPSPVTEYGFAGQFNVEYDNITYRLVGYSAFTNQFDVVQYVCGDNEAIISISGAGSLPAAVFTTRVFGFRSVVPYTSVTTNWYGFDTRRGTWSHETRFYDWAVDHYYGNICQGGQFSWDHSLFTADESLHFQFYSGIDGSWRDFAPGLIYKSTTSSWGGGGTVFYARDTLNAWGYDVAGNRSSTVALPLAKTTNVYRGQDYITLTRYQTDVNTMVTFFYNGNTNTWSSASVPDHHTTDGLAREYSYLHRGSDENVVVFYSSITDEIFTENLPDGISVTTESKDMMGWARSEAGSILFDAANGSAMFYNFNFDRSDLGARSAILNDTTADIIYGYSSLTGNESQLALDFEPYYVLDTGYVGYIDNGYNCTRCFAYNGLADSWVELIPEGSAVGTLVGTKTILVERSDRVYAFDPERTIVSVDDEESGEVLPHSFELSQNYPNPFNPMTTIEYSLPTKSHVVIEIYNVLGRKVRTLINRERPAGTYTVDWDGNCESGIRAASGVYLYRIKAEGFVSSRKMIMLK